MPSTSYFQSEQKLRTTARQSAKVATDAHVDCVSQLDQNLLDHWQRFRESNPALDNGCFHPEFSRAVQRVRDGVEYAVIRHDGEIKGVFPFQRTASQIGSPVGGLMNDFHGPITAPTTRLDLSAVLRRAGLKRFDFHALVVETPSNQQRDSIAKTRRVFRTLECPFANLDDVQTESGTQTYSNWLLQHSSTVRRQPQKTRRMVRENGPLRLEADCRDPALLEQVIEWKRARFRRTRTFDLLGLEWTSNFLRELFQTRTDDFQGQLSILWAGDKPVAGHMGFRSGQVLHYYVPAHDVRFGRFSPGTELMYRLTCAAAELNIRRIDFGYGPSELKDRFANGSSSVQCGCISFNPLSRLLSHGRFEARQALKRIPLKEPLKRIIRPLHPNLGRRNFR